MTWAVLFHAGLSSSQGPALKVSVEKSAVAGVGAGSTFPHDLAFPSRSFCFSINLLCPVVFSVLAMIRSGKFLSLLGVLYASCTQMGLFSLDL